MTSDVLVDLTPLDSSRRFGGTGRYIAELGRALAALSPSEKAGLQIDGLVAMQGPDPVGPVDWQGSPEISFPEEREIDWLMERRTRMALTLARVRPRLFHHTVSLGTPRGTLVPRVTTCLDVIRLVMHEEYLPGRWAYRRVLAATEALRFHSARRVLAISQHTADDLVKLLKVPASKIDVALLGVDLDRYTPADTDEKRAKMRETLARYKLTEKGYVFYVGRADPRKNVDILIRAFAAARVEGLELILIGKNRPWDDEVIAKARAQAGDPPGVRLLGFVPEEDLPDIMRGAMAFGFCSTYEGFGNVPVEAMACGCPVISTLATSMKETVADAGLLVPPRDVAATAQAIRRVAVEPGLWQQLSEAGHRRAQLFSWRNTALGTVECYRKALRG